MTDFKISLAAARVNANMTQEAAAKELKISKKTVVNWEKGSAVPSFASLKALADLYRIPIDYIFLPHEAT